MMGRNLFSNPLISLILLRCRFEFRRGFLLRQSLVASILVSLFILLMNLPAQSGTVNYTYDEGNRLIRMDYEDGSRIEYAYDESGNRILKATSSADRTAPVTTAAPAGGVYVGSQNITLACDDGSGSGCDNIYYTIDGSSPTASSSIFTSALAIASSTLLKFFATDLAGNVEAIKTQTYTIGNPLQVIVSKDAQSMLSGVNLYLFAGAGHYLGQSKTTDASGQAVFAAAPGRYKVRADYLGYQYWSDPVEVAESGKIDITIPHSAVNTLVNGTYQGVASPISSANVYLFSPAGFYLGLKNQTGSDGRATFSLPAKDYKVRVDYLGGKYFSSVFNAQDAAVSIPFADAEITVTQQSRVLSGVNLYAFTPAGSYLGIHGATDSLGKFTFRLPAGTYKFRADTLGNHYWSAEETLVADQSKTVAIDTGGGTFTLTVLKAASEPLSGVKCYLFSELGSYLGLSGAADGNGQAVFNVSNGNFKFRIDYLGAKLWTNVVTVPTVMNLEKLIAHKTVTVTIKGVLASSETAKPGVNVYLFSPGGSYLGLAAKTDADGKVSFNLPEQPFKVRADYLGKQVWSDEFTWTDKAVMIPEGLARVHVGQLGQNLPDIPVYVFNAAGSYLGLNGKTDSAGIREFRLPEGEFKIRADTLGNQYWATATIARDVSSAVDIGTGGGQFVLTVLKEPSDPLSGIKIYLFNAKGSYLGLSGTSGTDGSAAFNLPDGSYKFRVDYLGYQFWTDLFTVPAGLSGTVTIPHQNRTIKVEGVYRGSVPLAGVKVYLFTPSGSYLGLNQSTDAAGQAGFSLPDKTYKVRADTLGSQYWSGEFQSSDATVSISRGLARITAKATNSPVPNARVYVFSEAGSYLGLSAVTNADGAAEFLLPGKAYKFRVDSGGAQHWSAVTTIMDGQVNSIEIAWE